MQEDRFQQSLDRLNDIVQDEQDFSDIVAPLSSAELDTLLNQIIEDLLTLTESGQPFHHLIPGEKLDAGFKHIYMTAMR